MGALNAGLRLVELSEHSVDAALVAQSQRAEKHLGWPLLLLMKLSPEGERHGEKTGERWVSQAS
jgi:hypothetical protein